VKDIVPLSKNLLEQLADDTYEESIEDDLEEKETQVEQIKTIMNEIAFAFNDVNSTQTALMNYFTKTQAWEIVDLIPFSSARKYRAISFLNHGAYVLGAPEFILKDTVYTDVLKLVEPYSHQGLRVLLLASAEE